MERHFVDSVQDKKEGLKMYEKEINEIIAAHKIMALCTYYIGKLDIKKIYNLILLLMMVMMI